MSSYSSVYFVVFPHIRVYTYVKSARTRIQKLFESKKSGKFFWRMWSDVERNVSRYRGKKWFVSVKYYNSFTLSFIY